jgi:hypothetical protein
VAAAQNGTEAATRKAASVAAIADAALDTMRKTDHTDTTAQRSASAR